MNPINAARRIMTMQKLAQWLGRFLRAERETRSKENLGVSDRTDRTSVICPADRHGSIARPNTEADPDRADIFVSHLLEPGTKQRSATFCTEMAPPASVCSASLATRLVIATKWMHVRSREVSLKGSTTRRSKQWSPWQTVNLPEHSSFLVGLWQRPAGRPARWRC